MIFSIEFQTDLNYISNKFMMNLKFISNKIWT